MLCSTPHSGTPWGYLYIPQGLFERMRGNDLRTLVSGCAPALQDLLQEEEIEARYPLFAHLLGAEEEKAPEYEGIVNAAALQAVPSRYRDAVEQAAMPSTLVESELFGLICCGPGRERRRDLLATEW